ncbi:hypothetical protein CLV47_10466 [Antricoccus suffuscus]|uniref:Uncharacterized protein n=1 Tax=Antricoccus suffuscus TaxID=1629062 RepID=A0A2T1A296_9ACTN|nr:hypothetical protein CLV47_10466 [Antricoccus suffuscus]
MTERACGYAEPSPHVGRGVLQDGKFALGERGKKTDTGRLESFTLNFEG